MNIILFDTDARNHLLPLVATRPMAELRVGILTIREKWERSLKASASYVTQEYLQEKYPIQIEDENLVVNAGVLPNAALCRAIEGLSLNEALLRDGELIAARLTESQFESLVEAEEVRMHGIELPEDIAFPSVRRLWDLTQHNAQALADDYAMLTAGRKSQPISPSNQVLGAEQVFLEEGAKVECCIINATKGPVYIGRDAEVMEGSILRGPIAIGQEAIVKLGAKIYGPTTIGPHCRVGGEITRSIFIGHSNKAHDGYIGDSVVGEWCNLGADTNCSNLKNNYTEVRLWDYAEEKFARTGRQFCGLIMGDHSKCGINTMFNTGTVVGVFANIFGAGYPRNFIPDFSWGGADSALKTYRFSDACDTVEAVFKRRDKPFNDIEKAILYHIYDQTAKFRTWDK